MKCETNSSAFPKAYDEMRGLSIREYLIGQALAGVATRPHYVPLDAAVVSRDAIALADAVIEALNEEEGPTLL